MALKGERSHERSRLVHSEFNYFDEVARLNSIITFVLSSFVYNYPSVRFLFVNLTCLLFTFKHCLPREQEREKLRKNLEGSYLKSLFYFFIRLSILLSICTTQEKKKQVFQRGPHQHLNVFALLCLFNTCMKTTIFCIPRFFERMKTSLESIVQISGLNITLKVDEPRRLHINEFGQSK